MTIVFFDDESWETLTPLTFTRPVADLRIGILKISEKWTYSLKAECSYKTAGYLQNKFSFKTTEKNLFINGSILPTDSLLNAVNNISEGDVLVQNKVVIAANLPQELALKFNYNNLSGLKVVDFNDKVFLKITYPEDIFRNNDAAIRADFELLTKGRSSAS